MYESYWNLTRKPFAYRVDSQDLYPGKSQLAAQLRLRYCMDNDAGAAMLIGASGVGKSSLIRQFRSETNRFAAFVHVAFPTLSPVEMLRVIAGELCGTRADDTFTADALLLVIREELIDRCKDGLPCVVAIDEAHLVSQETLNESVLPLLNLVDSEVSIRLTVILSGQPVLGAHVSRNAQLRERIAVTAALEPFTDREVGEYIHTRMDDCGAERQVFTEDAIESVTQLSAGNVRRINRICDMALLVGFADQRSRITGDDVASLEAELLPAAA